MFFHVFCCAPFLCRDTLTICGINCFTSIFASCVIFSALGYIAKVQGADIEDVVVQGEIHSREDIDEYS